MLCLYRRQAFRQAYLPQFRTPAEYVAINAGQLALDHNTFQAAALAERIAVDHSHTLRKFYAG